MELSIEQQLATYTTDKRVLVCAGAGAGKCQPDYTLIPTPNGLIRLDQLKIGDKVFNRYGEEEKIIDIFPQGEKEIYEVELDDGRVAECCIDHLWSYDNGHGGLTTKTLGDIIKLGYKKKDNRGHNSFTKRIPNLTTPVQFNEKKLKIDPYIMGCFIGDGCCTETYLTISSSDEELVQEIAKISGFDYKRRSLKNYSWDFFQNKKIKTKEFFSGYEKELCCKCGEKQIPEDYLFSSINQRISLLQGLMDTDGSPNDGRHSPRYYTTSKKLRDQILFLCRSLGFHCNYREDIRENKVTGYDIKIFIPSEDRYKYFRLKRKIDICKTFKSNRTNHKFNSIRDIRKTGRFTSMRCILVDHPEHLYLTNDFIVTHNTRCLTERVKYLLTEQKVDPSTLFCITYTNMAAEEMKLRLGEIADTCFIGTIHSLANRILLNSGISTFQAIEEENFDKFFTMLQNNMSKLKLPDVQHLLVDEIQDICDKEYNFMRVILRPKNFWAVGDSRQCQPAGTKVRLRNNIYKNIEDIKVGDSVCWYDPKKSFVCGSSTKAHNAIEKRVLEISKREFVNDNIITITTENGEVSKYTPNHRTFIKLNANSELNHAVYLMCDEQNRFRIGKIPFRNENKTSHSNPWRAKMLAEGCNKIWILKLFKTDKEARVLEQKLSYKYGIPQTCFQTEKVSWSKEDIDYIYEGLNTAAAAYKCLKEYNRDINYPLVELGVDKKNHYAYNAVTEIYACNIMPEVMSCLVYDPETENHGKRYEQIIDVNFEYITEPIYVYSLNVEGETYVADNIVTHNSIYAFKGANYEIFMGLTEDPFTTVYELRDCYRCGPEVIEFANYQIRNVTRIYRTPTKCLKPRRKYSVEEDDFSYAAVLATVKEINDYKNTTILCRSNAMVDNMLFFLAQNDIPAMTFKKGDKTYVELQEDLKSDSVKVLTVHSAKGLEWDNVIVCQEVPPWNDEECRINYVAATRAKEYLLWLRPVRKAKRGLPQRKNNLKQQRLDAQMKEW